jgi:hypothetical protein
LFSRTRYLFFLIMQEFLVHGLFIWLWSNSK